MTLTMIPDSITQNVRQVCICVSICPAVSRHYRYGIIVPGTINTLHIDRAILRAPASICTRQCTRQSICRRGFICTRTVYVKGVHTRYIFLIYHRYVYQKIVLKLLQVAGDEPLSAQQTGSIIVMVLVRVLVILLTEDCGTAVHDPSQNTSGAPFGSADCLDRKQFHRKSQPKRA